LSILSAAAPAAGAITKSKLFLATHMRNKTVEINISIRPSPKPGAITTIGIETSQKAKEKRERTKDKNKWRLCCKVHCIFNSNKTKNQTEQMPDV